MDSKHIHDTKHIDHFSRESCLEGAAKWLKEIAYQLAVLNERAAAVNPPTTFSVDHSKRDWNGPPHQHCFLCQKPVSHCICNKKE
jgi:hypothetical protein